MCETEPVIIFCYAFLMISLGVLLLAAGFVAVVVSRQITKGKPASSFWTVDKQERDNY